jgi:hypothetical protein
MMSMTDIPEVPAKKKPAKRKKARRAPAAKTAAKADDVAYPGLTVKECAKACNKDGCVISGKSYCGHPRKGSQCDMSDPEAIGRLHKAQKQLALSDANKRFS